MPQSMGRLFSISPHNARAKALNFVISLPFGQNSINSFLYD
ncbi:hypothetical protein VDIAB_270446 [Vibrio diabolicus]|nr:hypothetical protein VDIAB_270446 [Vibrio diabolicus]